MSVLDTLEICFTANLSGVDAQLGALKSRLSGLSGSGKTYGRALSDGFAAGVRSGSSAVNSAVSAIVNSATRKIRSLLSIHSPSKVTQGYGAYFGEGFAKGVSESAQAAGDAAERMADGAVKRVSLLPELKIRLSAQAFGEDLTKDVEKVAGRLRPMAAVRLPLKLDGLGGDLAQSVSVRIAAAERTLLPQLTGAPLPEGGMTEGGMERVVQAAVDRALGDVQLTIPLSVDGMKLGEASIRGINAVTRSAGRLLLNI